MTALTRRRRVAVAVAAVCLLLLLILLLRAWAWPAPPVEAGPLRLYFLNVGQGDGALIVTPDGVAALVDGGDTGRGPGLAQWLHGMGIERVDWVMPSHPHADHIGGLNAVLERLTVGAALMSTQDHTTATFRRQKALIAERGVALTNAVEGMDIRLGDHVSAKVLNPPSGLLATNEPEEDNSVVLRVCLPPTCMLFTGDLGDQGERALLARYRDRPQELRSQVLKVSHHGSAEPNNPALLGLIQPEVALIGVGSGNPFGHPTRVALERVKATGAAIYCTHTDGTVLVEITSAGYSVELLREVVISDSRSAAPPPGPELAGTCGG